MPSETMNVDRINELLERYYDARTTEAEEQELKQFFAYGEVPDPKTFRASLESSGASK